MEFMKRVPPPRTIYMEEGTSAAWAEEARGPTAIGGRIAGAMFGISFVPEWGRVCITFDKEARVRV